jgi:hypothetical protein
MWIKIYEKKDSFAGDDISSMTDWTIKAVESYRIGEFEIELNESGSYQIAINKDNGMNVDMPMDSNSKKAESPIWVYAQAETESGIMTKFNEFMELLNNQ